MSRETIAVGVVACVACCAPPILAAVGITVGVAAVAWFTVGLLAAVVVLTVGAALIRRRAGAA